MRNMISVSFVVLFIAALSCTSRVTNNSAAIELPPRPSEGSVTDSSATIVGDDSKSWKATVTKLNSKESLRTLQLFEPGNGWTASAQGSIFKTGDGGNTWAKSAISMPEGASLSSAHFLNATIGWVALSKTSGNPANYETDQVWVMRTDDGGANWSIQYTATGASLRRIFFTDQDEGWAVGMRTLGLKPINQAHYVLHTSNGGRTWIDVSKELNEIASDAKGRIQDHTTDIHATSMSKAVVVSLRGKVFSTDDGGKSWRQVSAIANEPTQTCICQIGEIGEGRPSIWIMGSADSLEGMWGMLAVMKVDNSWTRYRTTGVYFRDAVRFSNEVFASGSLYSEKKSGSKGVNRDGVIMYSTDEGKTWTTIYRNSTVAGINALARTTSGDIYAVGDDGLVINLHRDAGKL